MFEVGCLNLVRVPEAPAALYTAILYDAVIDAVHTSR